MAIIPVAPKVTTVVAAAMETAGATIQSDMLDYVASGSGQTLAGLIYLIAIVGAIFAFASGGNYKWGRYLLVGPALFFFLTNVRTDSDGTEWAFGNRVYSQEAVVKALRAVDTPNNGGGTSVALVYHFWNIFMSEVVQELITLLNLNSSDAQFTFIQKIERYMQTWNFSSIKDRELRSLIKLTLTTQCSNYFYHLRMMNTPAALKVERDASEKIVNESKAIKVIAISKDAPQGTIYPELYDWMKERNMLDKSYSCQEMWEAILADVRKDVKDTIAKNNNVSISPEQDPEAIRKTFNEKAGSYTEIYSGNLADNYLNDDAAALYALDSVAARSLYLEIWDGDQYVQGVTLNTATDEYQMGEETFQPGHGSHFNESVGRAIQQFNITDKYAQRGEYVTAALSLPYFQGVGLLILSAAYPFFAMMVVMPGRALNFFTWMGLWAWLKLWDLGFAVVMMIDNMLYAMFPKGPNIESEEMKNAGIAFSKILEVDPNYSSAVYYNLIGTCMFAVPLVTAVFVKGGGGELANLLNQGWSAYAMRVAGAAASYSRSWQAQGYMGDLQKQLLKNQQKADLIFLAEKESAQKEIQELSKLITMANTGNEKADQILKDQYASQIETIVNKLTANHRAALAKANYDTEMSVGLYAANRAVASRYYNHDLAQSRSSAYSTQAKAALANQYYDNTKVATAAVEAMVSAMIAKPIKGFAGGGGK